MKRTQFPYRFNLRAARVVMTAGAAALAILIAPFAWTQENADSGPSFDAWTQTLDSAETRFSDPTISDFAVNRWTQDLEALIAEAKDAAAKARAQSTPFASQLQALGPAPEEGVAETESLAAERQNLQSKIAEFEADARRAESIAARAEQTLKQLRDWRRDAFAERLVTRSETPLSPQVISSTVKQIGDAVGRSRSHHVGIFRRLADEGLLATTLIAIGLGLTVAAGLIIVLRKVVIRRLIASVSPDSSQLRRIAIATALAASRLAIPLAAIAAIDLTLDRISVFVEGDLTGVNAILFGAAMIIATYALAYTYYAPSNPTLRLADLDESHAKDAANWAVGIAVLAAFDHLTQALGALHSVGRETQTVVSFTLVSMGAFAFWRFIAVNRTSQGAPREPEDSGAPKGVDEEREEDAARNSASEPIEVSVGRFARVAAIAIAAFAPLAAAAGYYALSRYALGNIILTTALFGVCTLLYAAVSGAVAALTEAAGARREGGGSKADFSLAPIVFGFFLVLVAIPVGALIWGFMLDDLRVVYRSIADGFSIGDFTFSPVDLVMFVAVVVMGVIVTRMVQSILRGTILPRTKLDEGARASIVSGVGYVGFPLAALAGVGAAGLDLSNIAIVAGALSVGIGFGLQNVVNNFVSGVILLVERPVKVGDWVVVGGEHGTVRKINVRSTEIQTFERTTLIVPNSELISTTVTNYTHNDLMGRLISPVGVAYGTDTKKVERILSEIARGSVYARRHPPPQVLFMGFGDSSLDFELRVFLRDVNDVLRARSAINFEIARRFEEEGIEIPFPQRDVNLRDIDRLVDAIRGGPAQTTG